MKSSLKELNVSDQKFHIQQDFHRSLFLHCTIDILLLLQRSGPALQGIPMSSYRRCYAVDTNRIVC